MSFKTKKEYFRQHTTKTINNLRRQHTDGRSIARDLELDEYDPETDLKMHRHITDNLAPLRQSSSIQQLPTLNQQKSEMFEIQSLLRHSLQKGATTKQALRNSKGSQDLQS